MILKSLMKIQAAFTLTTLLISFNCFGGSISCDASELNYSSTVWVGSTVRDIFSISCGTTYYYLDNKNITLNEFNQLVQKFQSTVFQAKQLDKTLSIVYSTTNGLNYLTHITLQKY